MMNDEDFFQANRRLWDTRTPLHLASSFYDVPSFRSGTSSLSGIELREMGDVQGKSILHLQCHFGLDTLSLARLGADVTGVDFSETAISAARSLANELDLQARFVCCNVLDLPNRLEEQFDIVFTSFGVLGWLPDLNRWANVVRTFLRPGGFLYLLEFHRQFIQLDDGGSVAYDYFRTGDPDEEVTTQTYADAMAHEPLAEYWWNHTMSDILSAVLRSGLQITLFHEFAYCAYCLNEAMVEIAPKQWVLSNLGEKIPYMFSLRAHNAEGKLPYGELEIGDVR